MLMGRPVENVEMVTQNKMAPDIPIAQPEDRHVLVWLPFELWVSSSPKAMNCGELATAA
jgi:hypothetical protein